MLFCLFVYTCIFFFLSLPLFFSSLSLSLSLLLFLLLFLFVLIFIYKGPIPDRDEVHSMRQTRHLETGKIATIEKQLQNRLTLDVLLEHPMFEPLHEVILLMRDMLLLTVTG